MIDNILPFWLVLPIYCVVGVVALGWITRRVTHAPWVARIVLSSFVLRAAVALSLFAMSYWQWPILRSLQLPGGFWAFGPDSSTYHLLGAQLVTAWHQGIDFHTYVELEYIVVIGGLYFLLGVHAMYPIMLNCWCAACSGLLAYVMGRRIADHRTGLLGSILVSFWPSSFIWSSQLLKDSLCIFLVMAALALLVEMIAAVGTTSWRRKAALYGGVCAVVVVMTRFRFYLGLVLTCATLMVLAWPAVAACLRRRWQRGLQYGLIMGMVTLSMLCARTLNVAQLISPPHPELGRWRLALTYWEQGEWAKAREQFERTVRLHRAFANGYHYFAATHVMEGRLAEALLHYVDLFKYEQDAHRRRLVGHLVMGLKRHVIREAETAGHGMRAWEADDYLTFGAIHAMEGRLPEAAEQYAQYAAHQVDATKSHVGLAMAAELEARIAEQQLPEHAGQAWIADATAPDGDIYQYALTILRSMRLRPASVEPPVDTRDLARAAVTLVHPVVPDLVAVAESRARPLMHQPTRLGEQVSTILRMLLPQTIGIYRRGFVREGGNARMDEGAQIATPGQVGRYLPRAMALGFFAPFPWQWFDTSGSTGAMRLLAGVEMSFVYLLCPAMLWGMWRLLRQHHPEGVLLVVFAVLLVIPLALVVSNIGILFRLRLQYLFPLLLVGAVGGVWMHDTDRRRRHQQRALSNTVPRMQDVVSHA